MEESLFIPSCWRTGGGHLSEQVRLVAGDRYDAVGGGGHRAHRVAAGLQRSSQRLAQNPVGVADDKTHRPPCVARQVAAENLGYVLRARLYRIPHGAAFQ